MRSSLALISALALCASIVTAGTKKYPFLITKENFMPSSQREDKSVLKVPKPFVVSTQLNVRSSETGRRGRTYKDSDGAVVVEGVRMPDDESDRITWRNGRVINNIFVPNPVSASSEGVPNAAPEGLARIRRKGKASPLEDAQQQQQQRQQRQQQRDLSYRAGQTNSGRPVYYVVDQATAGEELHADRSPYQFEPADRRVSGAGHYPGQAQGQHPAASGSPYQSQTSSDFVVQEHTYSMCPGCPTFSIPVPIPKQNVAGYQEEVAPQPPHRSSSASELTAPDVVALPKKEPSFIEKLSSSFLGTMKRIQDQALSVFQLGETKPSPESVALEKSDSFGGESSLDNKQSQPPMSPAVLAGMAAAVVGGMALLSSAATLSRAPGAGRSLEGDEEPAQDFFFAQQLYAAVKAMEEKAKEERESKEEKKRQ